MTLKQALWAEHYYTPGSESFGNALESARRAGYKGNDNTLAQRGHELVNNSKVKALKETLQAETGADTAYTIEQYQLELDEIKKEARTANQYGPATTATIAKGRSMGFDKDNRQDTGLDLAMNELEAADRKAYAEWKLRQSLAVVKEGA